MKKWSVIKVVEFLEKIQKDDAKKLKKLEENHGAASFCAECGQNKAVGRYPFWHRYARSLCSGCGNEYCSLLRDFGAVFD